MGEILPITMPKWGLAMDEGIVAMWSAEEGDEIATGQEILDIETSKVANAYESPVSGTLRRKVAAEGDVLPVGGLIGVVAGADVPDGDIDAFIEAFNESFVPPESSSDTTSSADAIEVDGRRIVYQMAGPNQDEAIIFVHGFGSDHKSWLMNQAELADLIATFAVDLPGHGASEKAIEDASADSLADTVASFVSTMELGPVHLVGHSLGAAVVSIVAHKMPDSVRSLSLIAPAGLGGTISGEFLDGFLTQTRAKKLRATLDMLVADPGLISAEMVEEIVKFKRLDGAQSAIEAVRNANFPSDTQTVDVADILKALEIPITIIIGSEDRIIQHDPTFLRDLGTLIEIKGAGHIPHMEKAVEVNTALYDFISANIS